MKSQFEDITIASKNGDWTKRARVFKASLADGSIRVGVFRDSGAWNFTDVKSGARILAVEKFNQFTAVDEFLVFLSGKTTAQWKSGCEVFAKDRAMHMRIAAMKEPEEEIPF